MKHSPDNQHDSVPDVEVLIDAHLDGVITDVQFALLQQWILADRENAKAYARRAMDHDHLYQMYSSDRVALLVEELGSSMSDGTKGDSWHDVLAILEEAEANADVPLVDITERLENEKREANRKKHQLQLAKSADKPKEHRTTEITIPLVAIYAAGLATAAVIALVLVPLFSSNTNQSPPDSDTIADNESVTTPPAQVPEVVIAPTPPATLVASHQTVWSASSLRVGDEGSLGLGNYAIDSGFVQLAMADGTSLIVEGPAAFSIDSTSSVTLSQGALSALVPEGAEGFIVDTPAGRVVDLGTEFGIEVLDEGTIEVHVMDGEVIASLNDDGAAQNMFAGEAGRLATASSEIESVPAHSEKFARNWEQVERSIRVSDAVRYLYDTPPSVAPGDLEDNAVLFILPEKRGVVVPFYAVLCDFLEPGRYERLPRESKAIPGGTVVDSYLLHYDRVGTPLEGLIGVDGTIHFDRPIIGIVASPEWIFASDALFQGADTTYPGADYKGRGFEGREHRRDRALQDIVTISQDRLTLTVHLETSTNIDQLRVLVEAAPADVPDPVLIQ